MLAQTLGGNFNMRRVDCRVTSCAYCRSTNRAPYPIITASGALLWGLFRGLMPNSAFEWDAKSGAPLNLNVKRFRVRNGGGQTRRKVISPPSSHRSNLMKKDLSSGPSTRKSVDTVQAVPTVHTGQRSGHSARRVITASAVRITNPVLIKGESK